MAHVQQQILEGVKAALITGPTDAGARVFLDRLDPLQANELPAILVEEAPEGEAVEPHTVSGLEQRSYAVLVTAVVAHASEYGSRARDMGLQIEKVLGVPAFAVPKAGRARVTASRMTFSGEGDRAMAAREQTWRFSYFTRRGAPDIAS